MIVEVDEALRILVRERAGLGADVEIVFEAPTTGWASRRNAPTVDLYLYDICEDVRRRERGVIEQRDERGIVIGRRPAPRYFTLSYLVTAWTQRAEDEHRLLDQVLSTLLAFEAIPDDALTGALADSPLPVPLSIALPPGEDRAFADVWTALGGELKPSLDVVVTVPADAVSSIFTGPPVTTSPIGRFARRDGAAEERVARRDPTDDSTAPTAPGPARRARTSRPAR